jgi:outer membrane protein TolC
VNIMKRIVFFVIIFSSITCFADVDEIKILQKQKVELLSKQAELCMMQFQMGMNSFSAFANAENELIDAQLEIIENQQERIDCLIAQMKIAEQAKQHSEKRFNAGIGGEEDAIKAKVLCLNIKIKLLKEYDKLKISPSPKTILNDQSHKRRRV